MGLRDRGEYSYLRSIDPALLERVIEAAGGLAGEQRAAAALVLKRGGHPSLGWSNGAYLQAVNDVQELAADLCHWSRVSRVAPRPDVWIRYRIGLGQLAYASHGSEGDCTCLWHRIWRMWLGEYGDALSEW